MPCKTWPRSLNLLNSDQGEYLMISHPSYTCWTIILNLLSANKKTINCKNPMHHFPHKKATFDGTFFHEFSSIILHALFIRSLGKNKKRSGKAKIQHYAIWQQDYLNNISSLPYLPTLSNLNRRAPVPNQIPKNSINMTWSDNVSCHTDPILFSICS